MGNDCRNALLVTGEPSALEAFAAAVRSPGKYATDLSLHHLVPLSGPESTSALPAWGTSRDVQARLTRLSLRDAPALWYAFDSPWAPPLRAFETGSAAHPALTFRLLHHEDWSLPEAGYVVYQAGSADLALEMNADDGLVELILDDAGLAIGSLDWTDRADPLTPMPPTPMGEATAALLRQAALQRPTTAALVPGAELPDAVLTRHRLEVMDRLEPAATVALSAVVLSPEAVVDVLLHDPAAAHSWNQRVNFDWSALPWLPTVLALHDLTGAGPATVENAVVVAALTATAGHFGPDLEQVRATVRPLLAAAAEAGVPAAAIVQLLTAMPGQITSLDHLPPVVLGALRPVAP